MKTKDIKSDEGEESEERSESVAKVKDCSETSKTENNLDAKDSITSRPELDIEGNTSDCEEPCLTNHNDTTCDDNKPEEKMNYDVNRLNCTGNDVCTKPLKKRINNEVSPLTSNIEESNVSNLYESNDHCTPIENSVEVPCRAPNDISPTIAVEPFKSKRTPKKRKFHDDDLPFKPTPKPKPRKKSPARKDGSSNDKLAVENLGDINPLETLAKVAEEIAALEGIAKVEESKGVPISSTNGNMVAEDKLVPSPSAVDIIPKKKKRVRKKKELVPDENVKVLEPVESDEIANICTEEEQPEGVPKAKPAKAKTSKKKVEDVPSNIDIQKDTSVKNSSTSPKTKSPKSKLKQIKPKDDLNNKSTEKTIIKLSKECENLLNDKLNVKPKCKKRKSNEVIKQPKDLVITESEANEQGDIKNECQTEGEPKPKMKKRAKKASREKMDDMKVDDITENEKKDVHTDSKDCINTGNHNVMVDKDVSIVNCSDHLDCSDKVSDNSDKVSDNISKDIVSAEKDSVKTEKASVKTEKASVKTEKASVKTEKDSVKTEKDSVKTEKDSVLTEKDSVEAGKDSVEKDSVQTGKDSVKTTEKQTKPKKSKLLVVSGEALEKQMEETFDFVINHLVIENGVLHHCYDDLNESDKSTAELKTAENTNDQGHLKSESAKSNESEKDTKESDKGESKVRIRKPQPILECPKCQTKVKGKSSLSRHLKTVHSMSPADCLFKCDIDKCEFGSNKRSILAQHMVTHDVFMCLKLNCSFKGDTKEALNEHLWEVHRIKEKSLLKMCKKCSRYIKCEDISLEHHIEICQGKVPFKCTECSREYIYESLLKVHMSSHFPDIPKKYSCDKTDCTYTTNYRANLTKHNLNRHIVRERDKQCTECDSSFYTEDKLKIHQKCHSKIERTHQCSQCEKCFKTAALKRGHELTHSQLRPFKCEYEGCVKDFRTARLLRIHVKDIHTHHGEKKFHCTVEGCKFTFYKMCHFKRHYITHTGERNYHCKFEGCGKSFRHADNLRVHKRQHTNEKPVACDKCDFRCRQKSSLYYHIKRHHPPGDAASSSTANAKVATDVKAKHSEGAENKDVDATEIINKEKASSVLKPSKVPVTDLYEFKSDEESAAEKPVVFRRENFKDKDLISSLPLPKVTQDLPQTPVKSPKIKKSNVKKEKEAKATKKNPKSPKSPKGKKAKESREGEVGAAKTSPEIENKKKAVKKKRSPKGKLKATPEKVDENKSDSETETELTKGKSTPTRKLKAPLKKKPGKKVITKAKKSPASTRNLRKRKSLSTAKSKKKASPKQKTAKSKTAAKRGKKKNIPKSDSETEHEDNTEEVEEENKLNGEMIDLKGYENNLSPESPTINYSDANSQCESSDQPSHQTETNKSPEGDSHFNSSHIPAEAEDDNAMTGMPDDDHHSVRSASPFDDMSDDLSLTPPRAPAPPSPEEEDEEEIGPPPQIMEHLHQETLEPSLMIDQNLVLPTLPKTPQMPDAMTRDSIENPPGNIETSPTMSAPGSVQAPGSVAGPGSVQGPGSAQGPGSVQPPGSAHGPNSVPGAILSPDSAPPPPQFMPAETESEKDILGQYLQDLNNCRPSVPEETSRLQRLEELSEKPHDFSRYSQKPPSSLVLPSGIQPGVVDMSHRRMEILATDRQHEGHFVRDTASALPRLPDSSFDSFSINSLHSASRENLLRSSDTPLSFSTPSAAPGFMRLSDADAILQRQRMGTPFLPPPGVPQPDSRTLSRIPEPTLRPPNPSLLRQTAMGRDDMFMPPSVPGAMPRNSLYNAWPGQDVRPPHWPQAPYLQRTLDRQGNSTAAPFFAKDNYLSSMFDPSRTMTERNMFASLSSPQPQRELGSETFPTLDRFELSNYFSSHPYSGTSSLDYSRTACGTAQKALDERYRQSAAAGMSEFRPLPPPTSSSDMFSGIGVNSGFNLDKYVYPRDAMYHPQHMTENTNSAFLSHTTPSQHSVFDRDYSHRTLYPHQNSPYPFIDERQYPSAAKLSHATTPSMSQDIMSRAAPTENQVQDPYRCGVLYNVMNRY